MASCANVGQTTPPGTVDSISGPRPYESAITPQNPKITALVQGVVPAPMPMNLSQTMSPEDNYRWGSVEGSIAFAGDSGAGGYLELADGSATVQINVAQCDPAALSALRASRVRVRGVCEG